VELRHILAGLISGSGGGLKVRTIEKDKRKLETEKEKGLGKNVSKKRQRAGQHLETDPQREKNRVLGLAQKPQ